MINSIYKNVRRKLSDVATRVFSRLTKKSQTSLEGSQKKRVKFCVPQVAWVCNILGVLMLTTLGNNVFAQELVYNGTNVPSPGVAVLEPASNLKYALPSWLHINQGDQGIVYKESNVWVLQNADLVIDYNSGTAPRFVIGGLSSMAGLTGKDNKVS